MNWQNYAIIGIILFIIIVLGIYWKRKNPRKEKLCNHNFKPVGHITCRNMIRIVQLCKRCGCAIHTPCYTIKQLREIEMEDYS